MSVSSNYQGMDHRFLIYLFSFCDRKGLGSASRVSCIWMQAAEKAKVIYNNSWLQKGNPLWQCPSRHPLFGLYTLLDSAQADLPIHHSEIRMRLMGVPLYLRREILQELSTQSSSASVEKALSNIFRLQEAITSVVLKRFEALNPTVQCKVGGKNDPREYGVKPGMKRITFLIHAMNQKGLLEHPCAYSLHNPASGDLLRRVMEVFNHIDENTRQLVVYKEQNGIPLKVLESLPYYLRQRLIILSDNASCLIPHDAAFQVLNVFFTFSRPSHKQAHAAFSGELPKGVMAFTEEDYLIAQRIIHLPKHIDQTKERALRAFHKKIEDLYVKAFLDCFSLHNQFPKSDILTKQTVLLRGLFLYKINENSKMWLLDLWQRLIYLWKPRGVDVEKDVDACIFQLHSHPKKTIDAENRFDNFKYLKMALIVVLDGLLYENFPPKISLCLELLRGLDVSILKGEISREERDKMDKSIDLLHRLCKAKRVDDYVLKYSSKFSSHPCWGFKHRYDDLFRLRRAIEDTLYVILFNYM